MSVDFMTIDKMDTNAMKKVASIIASANNEQAAAMRANRNEEEQTHCMRCGREITDFEETEFTGKELIFTYKCECGCYGEQHYDVQYNCTMEIW